MLNIKKRSVGVSDDSEDEERRVCPAQISASQEVKAAETLRAEITDMTDTTDPTRALLLTCLLLTCLLLTGARCKQDAVFMYSRLGGDALLPCSNLQSADCSRISWTFFKDGQMLFTQEVTRGQVVMSSVRSGRMSVAPNCSLSLRGLRVEDAGSYNCQLDGSAVTGIYLSLLTIASPSSITDLQPGGNITLSCILFTYYDAGGCTLYSREFTVSWVSGDGAPLPEDRYELIGLTNRCNVTLVTNLQRQDNNRRWRCQVNTRENSRAVSLDFTSAFLLDSPAQTPIPPPPLDCPVHLPISRILLCVALPIMVITVGCFRGDCRRTKASAAGIELQEIN